MGHDIWDSPFMEKTPDKYERVKANTPAIPRPPFFFWGRKKKRPPGPTLLDQIAQCGPYLCQCRIGTF